jgi:hypothetical protein
MIIMFEIFCQMCKHVAKDDQALVQHITKEHGFELYLVRLQRKIARIAGETYP